MCMLFHFVQFAINFLHRCVAITISCLITLAILAVMLFAVVAGIALGYNYSLSEWFAHKDKNVTVDFSGFKFLPRGRSDTYKWKKFDALDDLPAPDSEETSLLVQSLGFKQSSIKDDYDYESQEKLNLSSSTEKMHHYLLNASERKTKSNTTENNIALNTVSSQYHNIYQDISEAVDVGTVEVVNKATNAGPHANRADRHQDVNSSLQTTLSDEYYDDDLSAESLKLDFVKRLIRMALKPDTLNKLERTINEVMDGPEKVSLLETGKVDAREEHEWEPVWT